MSIHFAPGKATSPLENHNLMTKLQGFVARQNQALVKQTRIIQDFSVQDSGLQPGLKQVLLQDVKGVSRYLGQVATYYVASKRKVQSCVSSRACIVD